MNKKYYSSGEAAKILHISRVAIFKQIKSGKIKAEKVGRNYIITHDDVMEALGNIVGESKKRKIEEAVKRAVKEYGNTLKKLGEE